MPKVFKESECFSVWRTPPPPPPPGGNKPFRNPVFILPSTTVLDSDPYGMFIISHSRHTQGPPATAHTAHCMGCPRNPQNCFR